jgi:hypothetical protein
VRDWDGKAEPFQIHDTGWALILAVVLFIGAVALIQVY